MIHTFKCTAVGLFLMLLSTGIVSGVLALIYIYPIGFLWVVGAIVAAIVLLSLLSAAYELGEDILDIKKPPLPTTQLVKLKDSDIYEDVK